MKETSKAGGKAPVSESKFYSLIRSLHLQGFSLQVATKTLQVVHSCFSCFAHQFVCRYDCRITAAAIILEANKNEFLAMFSFFFTCQPLREQKK